VHFDFLKTALVTRFPDLKLVPTGSERWSPLEIGEIAGQWTRAPSAKKYGPKIHRELKIARLRRCVAQHVSLVENSDWRKIWSSESRM
jgi:hypothetical protein